MRPLHTIRARRDSPAFGGSRRANKRYRPADQRRHRARECRDLQGWLLFVNLNTCAAIRTQREETRAEPGADAVESAYLAAADRAGLSRTGGDRAGGDTSGKRAVSGRS